MSNTDSDTTLATAVRASDAERDAVRARLLDASAAGRINSDEAEERGRALSDTRFRHELDAFTADLPPEALAAEPVTNPRSVRHASRSVGAAPLAFFAAVFALANRHRLITAGIVIVVIAACLSLMVFLGHGGGTGHEGRGRTGPRTR